MKCLLTTVILVALIALAPKACNFYNNHRLEKNYYRHRAAIHALEAAGQSFWARYPGRELEMRRYHPPDAVYIGVLRADTNIVENHPYHLATHSLDSIPRGIQTADTVFIGEMARRLAEVEGKALAVTERGVFIAYGESARRPFSDLESGIFLPSGLTHVHASRVLKKLEDGVYLYEALVVM
jgi:hypothetical protein